jgi:DNA polymerase-3 subunit beta
MKLAIERAALLRSLSHVQAVVERRTTIPILSNVKLAAGGDGLHLTATDMDLSMASSETARVQDEGATTVSAHTLFDIVRKLPDGSEVLIEQEPNASEISVRAGRAVFTLPCIKADEFPAMDGDAEAYDVTFDMPAADLRKLIDKTRFAISTEETRYYLNGIHVHASGAGATAVLRGVATDGHRLAKIEIALPDGAEGIPSIIIPRKTVTELRKLIDAIDGEIRVKVSTNRIQFVLDQAVLVSRLIDGTFPDYERVIPVGNEKVAAIDTKRFAETVDRVSTISTERARAIKLRFDDGRITASAVSTEAGRAVEELDADYAGEPLEIGFNSRYILDMLAEVAGDQVRLEMANPAAPTLVRDPADGSVVYVLMPMRV